MLSRHPFLRLLLYSSLSKSLRPRNDKHIKPDIWSPVGGLFGVYSTQSAHGHWKKPDVIPELGCNVQLVDSSDPVDGKPPTPPTATTATATAKNMPTANPEILVALGAFTIVGPTPAAVLEQVNTHMEGENLANARHTASMLDALAKICVYKSSQTFAVALQINSKANKVRLTVAGNSNVPQQVVHHLKAVWEIMTNISNIHAKNRASGVTLGIQKKPNVTSRSITNNPEYNSLIKELQRTVYEFSPGPFDVKLERHRARFQKFAVLFKSNIFPALKTGSKEHKTGLKLIGVIDALEHTLVPLLEKPKSSNQLEASKWRELLTMMDGILYDCGHILRDVTSYEKWLKLGSK